MQLELRDQPSVVLPAVLLNNLREVHGDNSVDAWLEGLPGLLDDVLTLLGARIVLGEPPLSYHLVFFAERSNGEVIVVKCTIPNDEQPPEVAAVHALSDADIGPHLLWFDLDRGVLAMARVRPGDMLPLALPSLEEDAEITRTMATLASRMAREVEVGAWQDDLVPIRQYTRALGEVDPASALWKSHRSEIERAVDLREAMLGAPDQRSAFLHGDLQHHNVLREGPAGLRVIDPKGLVGPAGYEFGALTYNPPGIQHHPDLAAIERQRISIWSEISGLPWETVRSWGYVAAVLSACWSGQGAIAMHWHGAMKVALTLRELDP